MSDEPTITLPLSDYRLLLESAELDEDLLWCEVCGAWLTLDDPARATIEDFTGCWRAAIGEEGPNKCRSYRAIPSEAAPSSS